MTDSVNLSADLGEGFGRYAMADDMAMLDIVSSANIACGFHAGDPRIMHRTVEACVQRGVAIGAHPGFPDLVGFGRRALAVSPQEVYADVLYQVGALSGFARVHGARLGHVTPHGALGGLTRRDEAVAEAFVQAIQDFDPSIRVVSREGHLTEHAERAGLPIGYSGFADRAYQDSGELVPRDRPGAVIKDPATVAARVVRMVRDGVVTSESGKDIPVRCNSVVVHGDTADSVALARAVADSLRADGVSIADLSD